MLRWSWSGFTFIAFLIIVFGVTYVITKLVMGTQVQAATQPAITWVTPTPNLVIDPASKQAGLLLPVMSSLLKNTPVATSQANVTPTLTPTTQEITATATLTAQKATIMPTEAVKELAIPSPGGTCISGSIIDHYHQARGQGWGVTVTSGGVSLTVQADSQGRFQFSNLAAGVWTATLNMPVGWQPFTPNNFSVTLSGRGPACAEVRFKVEPPACVEIIKVDKNGPQPGVGLPGWVITGTHERGLQVNGITNGLGRIRFEGLILGQWTFTEQSQVGWVPVEGESGSKIIELKSPKDLNQCEVLKFVNEQVHDTCLTVLKVDENGRPIPDWPITLTSDDGTWPGRNDKSDENGQVIFPNLPLGSWAVSEGPQNGWMSLSPTTQHVNLNVPSTTCNVVTFQNTRTTCIEGYKINHLDLGLPDWTIYATNKATGVTKQAVTDGQGFFRFDNLIRGTWVISEERRLDWEALTPSEFEIAAVEPRGPGECYPVRFKNRFPYSCLDVYKLDATDGAGLPGWNITLKPAYGGTSETKSTDGIGHTRFEKLLPGEYTVSEETKSGWFPLTESSLSITLETTGSCKVVTFENCQEISSAENSRCKR